MCVVQQGRNISQICRERIGPCTGSRASIAPSVEIICLPLRLWSTPGWSRSIHVFVMHVRAYGVSISCSALFTRIHENWNSGCPYKRRHRLLCHGFLMMKLLRKTPPTHVLQQPHLLCIKDNHANSKSYLLHSSRGNARRTAFTCAGLWQSTCRSR